MYIYIYPKPQTTKTPSRILRLFQPEKGWLRDHTFNHPFERTFSICTRNPSRWNTSRWSSRGTLASSSLIRCNWQALEFTVLGDRPETERERGEGRLSWWRGQERVTCPRHLQFFFPCLAPARCPRSQPVTTDRPVPRNGAKISLKLIERGCYDFLRTGGAHTIAVSWINYRLTYVRTAIFFFFFSAPVKYSSPKDSKRIIPFFLFTDNFVRKHRKEISKFEDWYYYFHFEEKLNFTKGCSILYQYYASVKGEPQKKDHRCI